ncbi:hypothetical protein MJO29_002160 [Puccinia striiformis f. sp. tritici]|nr:hypothetical protein MJO29_002160 [Puccinia striiformis f. sp. tritici]
MAPAQPPDNVPSTPPNQPEDPDVPQSTRRESSRIRTPLSRPGFIPTAPDSRRALIGNPTQPGRRPATTPHSNPTPDETNEGDEEEESSDDVIETQATGQRPVTKKVATKVTQVSKRTGKGIEVDLAQDSDDEHSRLATKKDKTKDSNGFDHWVLYFHPLGQGPNQKPDSESFACRWCPKEVMVSDRSTYNLKSHRDGENYKSSKKKACAGRAKAIQAGSHLPPTPAELIAEKAKTGAAKPGTLVAYTSRGRFDNTTMIKLLIIWLIRECLPWLRMEDFHLRLAFDHAIVTSKLPSAVWAAGHAHRLYLEQRSQVIKLITESDSKISLISDVWTTKGSHKAFVGITACYINKRWEHVTQHLAIKYISWHHNAQTTDSGSNNFTMARAVAATIKAFDSTTWDVERNHHRCICHVIALILGAGLKALELSTKMVRPERSDESFPSSLLATITEEDEPENNDVVELIAEASEDDDVDPVDAERGLGVPGWEDDNEGEDDGVKVDESGIGFTLKKIDYICRRIAGSPQKQAEWKLWAKTLGYKGRGVIGGYGIRWNIAYDSRQRAYEGRRVIKQLLENESEKFVGRSAAKHFFNSYELSSKEWDDVNSLNQVLKEFLEMTKRLEGDGPKLPMVLYEYARLLASLEKKKIAAVSTALERMFYPMITITRKYLDLAIHCDTVVMATFLHPAWRMMLFTDRYSIHLKRINKLISDLFTDREELLKALQPDPTPPKCTQSEANASGIDSDSDGDAFNYYPTNGDTVDINTELDRYNKGDFPLDKKGCVLGWWKAHSKDFPVLGSLARDYLACAASSASVERTFSAAARVCATGRSSLAIRTIERCISSHMWLRDSVRVGGLFSDCQDLIDAGLKNPKFARYTVKPVKKSRDIRK